MPNPKGSLNTSAGQCRSNRPILTSEPPIPLRAARPDKAPTNHDRKAVTHAPAGRETE